MHRPPRIHVFVISGASPAYVHDRWMSIPRSSRGGIAIGLVATLVTAGLVGSSPAQATISGLTFSNRTLANSSLVDNRVRAVYAIDDTIYAGAEPFSGPGGLSISSNGGGTFSTRNMTNGLGSNNVYGVYTVGSTVYAATDGGVSLSTDGGTSFTNRSRANTGNTLGSNQVNGVYVTDDTIYAATGNGLSISINSGATFVNRRTGDGLGNNQVYAVYAVGSTVYAATTGGLSISTDGGSTFSNRNTSNGLGNNQVYGVYAVGSTVYAATNGGLSISTDGGSTFTNRTTSNGLGNNRVNGVYAVGSTVYAATNSGLSISTNGGSTFTNYTTADGLGDNYVNGVYATGATVYAATNGGVSVSTPMLSGLSATAGDSSASVAWTVDSNGGSTLTRIEFALDDTLIVDDSTTNVASPHTLTMLTNGQTYTVYSRAVNATGTGPWSTASAPFTPQAPPAPPPPPVYPPSEPLGVTAVAGDASAVVTWTAPSDPGSYAISTYQVTAAPGGKLCLASAPSLTCEVIGLTNGTDYTFTVRALNGAGWGSQSVPSDAVTPRAPARPVIVITGSRSASVIDVTGTSTGLGMGAILRPWVRFPGQGSATQGVAEILIDTTGSFAWQRRTSKTIHVYVATADGSTRSNTVTLPVR